MNCRRCTYLGAYLFFRGVNIIRWWVNTTFQAGKCSKCGSLGKNNIIRLSKLDINLLTGEKLSILRVCKTLPTYI